MSAFQGDDGREIQTQGFLDDYEQLAPGHKDQANLIFIDAALRRELAHEHER